MTITQYLSPTRDHLPVTKYYSPTEFAELCELAERIGFAAVEAGPLVRTSYKAGAAYRRAMAHPAIASRQATGGN